MTEVLREGPQSPGSLVEFAATRGYDLPSRATHEYNSALAQYRVELAEARGITLEELHQAPLRDVGRLASREVRPPAEAEAA